MMSQQGTIRIGTSNVVIPGNKSEFPPAFRTTSRLHYYSTLFNTVEINSCFYKTPLLTTYERWVRDTTPGFQFTLKLSKEITHVKNLVRNITCMNNFLTAAAGAGNKKGCLLVQFPGKITLDYFKHLEQILEDLDNFDSGQGWRKAVEFRNTSWYTGETRELLDEHHAAMVLHDNPKAKVFEVSGRSDFIYMRFHGPKGDYRDSYTGDFLKNKAVEIKHWSASGKDVYVYFNNTIGSAFENAQTLKAMLL